jgi:FtsH-binding integral membrane protein
MRLWLNDSERRADPAPAATDDRKAILAGLALWVVTLVVVLIVLLPQGTDAAGGWIWTCVVGLALGLVGLVYTHTRRPR